MGLAEDLWQRPDGPQGVKTFVIWPFMESLLKSRVKDGGRHSPGTECTE